MNFSKWFVLLGIVLLALAVIGGLVYNNKRVNQRELNQRELQELQFIDTDMEKALEKLEPLKIFTAKLAVTDDPFVEIDKLLGEVIIEMKLAKDFVRKKDLNQARWHYYTSIVQLQAIEWLLAQVNNDKPSIY